jgi:hypothetical protein
MSAAAPWAREGQESGGSFAVVGRWGRWILRYRRTLTCTPRAWSSGTSATKSGETLARYPGSSSLLSLPIECCATMHWSISNATAFTRAASVSASLTTSSGSTFPRAASALRRVAGIGRVDLGVDPDTVRGRQLRRTAREPHRERSGEAQHGCQVHAMYPNPARVCSAP